MHPKHWKRCGRSSQRSAPNNRPALNRCSNDWRCCSTPSWTSIFPGFDDVWTVYDSPGAGGMFFTSPVAGVKVKDYRQAFLAYTGALDLLKGSARAQQGGASGKGSLLNSLSSWGSRSFFSTRLGRASFRLPLRSA